MMKGLIEYIWEAPAIWIIGVIVAVVTLNLIILFTCQAPSTKRTEKFNENRLK